MAKAPEALDPSIWHPELLAAPLRAKRLTVLYGPPGALRDGMLRRGLMPLLRQAPPTARGRPRRAQVPIRFDGWGPLPLQALRTRIDAEFRAAWPNGAPDTLAAHLRAIGRQHHATVLLVLDAFERHLGERAERHDIERFDIELSECITHDAVPLHVLMVVDELENRALQRYTRWIAHFGDDFLRLPSLVGAGADTIAWRDTDIEAPRADIDDAADEAEAEWSVDLLLEPAAIAEAPMPVAAPALPPPAPEAALPVAEPPPAPVEIATPGEPESSAAFPFDAREGLHADAERQAANDEPAWRTVDSQANAPGHGPPGRIEPVFIAEPVPPPPAAPAPAPAPTAEPAARAAALEAPAGARAARAHTPAPSSGAPRSVPPWLSEADIEQMRRMHEPRSRWPGLLGLALYMVVLLAGAWWVARWIIDSQRVETRPSAADSAPAATQPEAAPAPAATPPAPPQGAAPAPAPAPAPAAPAANGLAMAWPPESASAGPLVDDLIRLVAAPAGVLLRAPAANEPPALTLMRTDALMAARAANTPLRIVAPLFNEQVQVLVRTDARWDYVREIRGLRLNIGRADGARARTARALYQQLFRVSLPAAQANELDLDGALRALQQRGGPIDAIVVVSEAPLESQLQPAAQRQVRELTIEGRQGAITSLPGFTVARRSSGDRARLSTTSYLVAPGAPPRPYDALLRSLALALCRAQPLLQKQDSPLLRGFKPNQQPEVGHPYVLPRTPEGTCPVS